MTVRGLVRCAVLLALLPSQGMAQSPSPAAATRAPELHYRLASYTFEVPTPVDDDHPPGSHRRVQWSYPVFADTRDPATRKFNDWLRTEALDRLLPGGPLRKDAAHLSDREVVRRAAADPAFIDSRLAVASVMLHAAADRYRSVWSSSASPQEGSAYADSDSAQYLYDRRDGRTHGLSELFATDDDAPFEALFQEARKADGVECGIERHFDWSVAWLAGAGEIGLLYPFDRREDPRCGDVRLDDPKIAGLLKNPGELEPEFKLLQDGHPAP